ncbi:hypothetical protein ACEQPO_10095 [Bacillus sp. SL00103]
MEREQTSLLFLLEVVRFLKEAFQAVARGGTILVFAHFPKGDVSIPADRFSMMK